MFGYTTYLKPAATPLSHDSLFILKEITWVHNQLSNTAFQGLFHNNLLNIAISIGKNW